MFCRWNEEHLISDFNFFICGKGAIPPEQEGKMQTQTMHSLIENHLEVRLNCTGNALGYRLNALGKWIKTDGVPSCLYVGISRMITLSDRHSGWNGNARRLVNTFQNISFSVLWMGESLPLHSISWSDFSS